MAHITLYECRGLRSIDPLGRQDPFVQVSLGPRYKKRSKGIKNGGSNPNYNEEELLMWLDQDNWVEDLKVEVLDEDAKEDKPIGTTHFSMLPYMKQIAGEPKEEAYDLFYYVQLDPKDDTEKKEVACGEIIMRVSSSVTNIFQLWFIFFAFAVFRSNSCRLVSLPLAANEPKTCTSLSLTSLWEEKP